MTEKKTQTKKKQGGNPLDVSLAEARAKISHIERDSRNQHFKFDYASGENMIAAARKVLAECGILVTLAAVEHYEVAGRLMQGCKFIVTHIESGAKNQDTFSCPVVGGADDKASFGCNTGIWKYYLRGLLMLPMVDEVVEDTTPTEEPCAREDDFDRGGAINKVKNLFEEMQPSWTEAVMKWVDNVVPDKMTNEQLQIIIEKAESKKKEEKNA